MEELPSTVVHIRDGFWSPRQQKNASRALEHQWDQLEKSGCIDNFRLAAREKDGFREGWFFADSDAVKWLDAACRVYATSPSPALGARIQAFVDLIRRAQASDGYLYTYNQIHFPGQRWLNLQIEHELYCHGHLIEAAVSHCTATGQRDLLCLAERAADLLVDRFGAAGPEHTPGHEEIELALIRLYRLTGTSRYLDLAERFIEHRGRIPRFARSLWRQNQSVAERSREVRRQRAAYRVAHPAYTPPQLPPGNQSYKPRGVRQRFLLNTLTGRYFQQHRPVREQTEPVGHAVRLAYLQASVAMLCRERGDLSLLPPMEQAWARMVRRRMYVTGGIGSLPEIEGFGRDYELDPYAAYAETCAALGCMFWNWEMSLVTRQARYADLFEWQLYNAASVGMGTDGTTYLYNNPLASRGGVTRRPWFQVPCCPSNLSRTWASLGQYVFSHEGTNLWVHQYIGCRTENERGLPAALYMDSELPWKGRVAIRVEPASPVEFALHLRIPSWCEQAQVMVNRQPLGADCAACAKPREGVTSHLDTASGYSPFRASYLRIQRTWAPGDTVELSLGMPITVRRPHPRVMGMRGHVAVTRGPLVYCLESIDNPGLDLFAAVADLASLKPVWLRLLGEEMVVLQGRTANGQTITAIPYYAWANRGESQMTVQIREG